MRIVQFDLLISVKQYFGEYKIQSIHNYHLPFYFIVME